VIVAALLLAAAASASPSPEATPAPAESPRVFHRVEGEDLLMEL